MTELTKDDHYNQGQLCHFAYGDHQGAAEWYLKAAEQEHPEAQHFLGMLYEEGLGVEQCRDTAHFWLRRSAENGSMESILAMIDITVADAHLAGNPTPLVDALPWLIMAAKQGHAKSQHQIKTLHARLRKLPSISPENQALLLEFKPVEIIPVDHEALMPPARPALLACLLIALIAIILGQYEPRPVRSATKLSFTEAVKTVEPVLDSRNKAIATVKIDK